MSHPSVSFIVPLYNCLPLTKAMLASLRATLPEDLDYEVILVDDGSTDGTRQWLSTLSHPHRIVLNERNLGYGAATNRGAAIAWGEYLCLLNSDLILLPGWLEPMLEAHECLRSRAGIIGNVQLSAQTGALDHAGILINHKGKPEHIRTPLWRIKLANHYKPFRRVPAVTGACVLVLHDLWRELHGYDESFVNGCEDVDLCLRAAVGGQRNLVALGSVVRHHVSPSPGRKRLDEANTYRLTLRWRDALVSLGIRRWCRHHFETHLPEPRDFPDPSLARQVVLYLLRLRRMPPAGAYPGMGGAIDVEIGRWREMLGELPNP